MCGLQPFRAACRHRRPIGQHRPCHASAQSAAQLPQSQQTRNELLFQAVEALFKFPPFFNFAAAQVCLFAAWLFSLYKPDLVLSMPAIQNICAVCVLHSIKAALHNSHVFALQARAKIAQRGRDIGLDFEGEVAALREVADWDAELCALRNPSLSYPSYYTQPFHAYPEGNLCWDAALQVKSLLTFISTFVTIF